MSNYWEKRAAQRMYEDMKTAEDAAEDIRKLYERASRYIQSQGQDIFDAFRRQTGLTEEEARRYLTQARSPADIQAVINFAKQIQDPERKRELLRWINASATQGRLARLAVLHEAIDNLVPMLYASELKIHQDAYSKILQDAYLHKTFDIQQYSGLGKFVTPLDAKKIDRILHRRWLGSNYSSRLWGNTNRLAQSLRDELTLSYLTGRPQLDTWRAIEAEFQTGHHAARRLVRTESSYLANQGHAEAYKDSGVEKYIYVATLDLKTSEICRDLDGKRFLVKNAKPGVNYPPMHPWCRSTTIAWMPDQLLAKMKRTARDPVTGRNYKVPANMTYSDWYKKYVKNNQNTAQPKHSERNLTRTQYDNYKARLGNGFPYSYDEFIMMKSDKGLWKAWQKSYKDSAKSDKYNDLTEVWRYNHANGTADVTDNDHYLAPDGQRYDIDPPHVFHKHTAEEYRFAEELSKAIGHPVKMTPEVVGKHKGVKTPDFISGESLNERWEEKTIRCEPGKDYLRNEMSSKKAEHYAFDITNRIDSQRNVIQKAEEVFSSHNKKYVQSVVLYEDGQIIRVYKRK